MRNTLLITICIIFFLLLVNFGSAAEMNIVVVPANAPVVAQSPLTGLLPIPILMSPANGTVFTHFPREMVLAWRPVDGAKGYRVEIATWTGSWWIPFTTRTVSGPNTTFYQVELERDCQAVWRVTALGTTSNNIYVESLPSPWRMFSWNTRQTLTTPVLVSPGGGTVFFHYPRITTLAWNPVPGATGYVVERDILEGSDWQPLPDITVTGEPNSSCTFDSDSNGSCRWRVTATDGLTFGNSVSGWWQFTFVN
ncbi:MAG TPA: hypothetical protein PLU94_03060 [Methanoregulaceae archaeon]|nr:hypothetical protein [Methanoregulaceae archaeon]